MDVINSSQLRLPQVERCIVLRNPGSTTTLVFSSPRETTKNTTKVTEEFAKKNSSETRPEVAENLRLVEHPHAELRLVGWVELGFGV